MIRRRLLSAATAVVLGGTVLAAEASEKFTLG